MLEAQSLGHTQHMRSFLILQFFAALSRQLELIENVYDMMTYRVYYKVAAKTFLNADDVRGLLSFFRCLQEPGDIAAPELL